MRQRTFFAVYGDKQRGGFGSFLTGLAFFIFIMLIVGREPQVTKTSFGSAVAGQIAEEFVDALYVQFIPAGADYVEESNVGWLVRTQTRSMMPVYGVETEPEPEYIANQIQQETTEPEEITAETEYTEKVEEEPAYNQEELMALMEAENHTASSQAPFAPHEKRVQVNTEELKDYETLIESFYTIDANTMIGSDELNAEQFLGEKLTLDKSGEGPQILIYHTHSQEAFADSVPGDTDTTIVGVGERLAQILQEEYGYRVLHHTGQYDVDTRDDAYGKALPAIEQILEENPSIQVVIDLHRDQMPEETKLVMDLDGRPTARFMFFNGLSRTRQSGEIDYLQNDNLDTNLAFSFQMQLKCEEYYPGLTRKIYLKGYRYNMHLRPRTLLVELGAQNNTVEEAMNACDPLAHVLDMVLSGE